MSTQQPFDYSSYPGQQPAPGMQAPAPEPAPKKKKKVGCLGWTLGIVAALAVFGLATGGGDEDTGQTAPSSGQAAGFAASGADAEPAEAAVPTDHRSALRQAENYSELMHMSKAGLYDQLVSEYGGQFTPEAAQYAVDNVDADWNLNALESARAYQETMNMSPGAIHSQLTSEYGGQFTVEQADYAIAHLN